jgi:hypothetical protein
MVPCKNEQDVENARYLAEQLSIATYYCSAECESFQRQPTTNSDDCKKSMTKHKYKLCNMLYRWKIHVHLKIENHACWNNIVLCNVQEKLIIYKITHLGGSAPKQRSPRQQPQNPAPSQSPTWSWNTSWRKILRLRIAFNANFDFDERF